jgi:peptide/nickel transport system permease protein
VGASAPRELHMSEGREKLMLFLHNGLGIFGLLLVILFFASAIFAPLFATSIG